MAAACSRYLVSKGGTGSRFATLVRYLSGVFEVKTEDGCTGCALLQRALHCCSFGGVVCLHASSLVSVCITGAPRTKECNPPNNAALAIRRDHAGHIIPMLTKKSCISSHIALDSRLSRVV